MMLRSCYRCLGRRGGSDGLLWHSDLKPHASGDYSIAVVQANSNLEDQSQVFTSPSATYVGVYDGHGGPEASRFVNKHLFSFLHSEFCWTLFSFMCVFLCLRLSLVNIWWVDFKIRSFSFYFVGCFTLFYNVFIYLYFGERGGYSSIIINPWQKVTAE